MLEAAGRQFPDIETPDLPAVPELAPEQGAELARALGEPRVLTCALEALRRREVDGWPELFAAALPHSPRPVCRMIAQRLATAGETSALAAGAAQVVSRPDAAGSAVAWLWRQCRAGQPTPGLEGVHPLAALFKLLSTAASLVRDRGITSDERKEQVAELRSAIFVRDGATLREVVTEAPPEQLASLAGMVERNPVLTGQMRARIVHVLQEAEPSLFARHVPAWQEDCIYTTEEGLERRRAELRRVVDVRLPQVVREIGEAASFGDVSDNAEYQSAIRERSRLADLAERMRQEIARARPITRQMAETEHVTVGSRVKVRNLETGEEQALRFLGPWDADPDAGIYAYNAPLGEQFMGRRPGEEVTFQAGPTERRWEILEVAPAL